MKKSTIFFFSAIICILGSIGFFAANAIAKSPAGNRAKDKSLIRKNFPVSTDFAAVKLKGVADIVYSESASAAGRSVYAMVPKCMLPYLKITNRDGRLVISTANDNKHESINCKVRATVYITGGSLRDIELEGVGNFSVKGTLHASSEGLDIDLEGVAAFSAPIIRAANSKIKVDAEGVGNIDLGDVTCRLLDISSQGTSNLTASRLKASTLDIEAEGTGMVRLDNISVSDCKVDNEGTSIVSLGGRASYVEFINSGTGNIEARGLAAERGSAIASGTGSISCNVARLSKSCDFPAKIKNIR